jgi:alpha-1,6-mannosyltransferase
MTLKHAQAPTSWSISATLSLAAVTIEIVLYRLTRLMSLPEFFPGKERISLDFVKMLGPDWLGNTVLQTIAFLVMFAAFGAALWVLRRAVPSRWLLAAVFAPPVVWSATAAFMYPPYAVDLFHYLADSRLLWIYRLNPLVVAPIARPFIIATSYGDQASAYGPLWHLLSFPGAVFQPGNYLSSIILLKLWIALFYLASGGIIFLILKLVRPDLALMGAALYLWNPFVIMRDLGDGHNDVVMFFFVLLAFYWAAKEEWIAVGPALMLSALIKYVSVLLGPLVLVYVLALPSGKRRPALIQLLAGGAIALLLAVLIYAPFWAGSRTFASIRDEGELSITSTPLLVQLYITGPFLHDASGAISRLWTRVIFLIPYAWLLLRVRPPVRRLYGASYQTMFLFILIATAWFRPWYLIWVVTLGALLPSGWFLALTLAISFCGMFPDIVEQYRAYVPWLAADSMRLYLAPIVVAFLAPALIWIAALIGKRSWDFPAARDPKMQAPAAAID